MSIGEQNPFERLDSTSSKQNQLQPKSRSDEESKINSESDISSSQIIDDTFSFASDQSLLNNAFIDPFQKASPSREDANIPSFETDEVLLTNAPLPGDNSPQDNDDLDLAQLQDSLSEIEQLISQLEEGKVDDAEDLPPTEQGIDTTQPSSFDVDAQASRISGKDLFRALNLPEDFTVGAVDATSIVPGLGDQTGITLQIIPIMISNIFTSTQRALSAKNFLETAPRGVNPNPNFSYIEGRPPYSQDTPEGQRLQEAVFARLRQNIISQLSRIVQQLELAAQGLQTQNDLAQGFKTFQDGLVRQAVQNSQGNGGGR